MRLDYQILLRCGPEEVVRVKSQLVLPMALAFENLPQTDVSFPELLDQVIVRPLVAKFRSILQKLFDAASQTDATKEKTPEPATAPENGAAKSPSSRRYTMPVIDPSPPLIIPRDKVATTLSKNGE